MEVNILVDEDLEGCLEESWLRTLAEKVLSVQSPDFSMELGLVIVGKERMQELNLKYRGENEPTDVLAFALLPEPAGTVLTPFVTPPDGVKHLGEVIICYPQAVSQAEEHRHSIKREIAILTIHGLLHLLGYEHDQPELEQPMRARETEILSHLAGELE